MNKGQVHILKGILYEYDGLITVADAELVVQGSLLTSIEWNERTDELKFYSGDLETDKYAEELIPSNEELDLIYDYVVDNF